jgi:hypothetical protein
LVVGDVNDALHRLRWSCFGVVEDNEYVFHTPTQDVSEHLQGVSKGVMETDTWFGYLT